MGDYIRQIFSLFISNKCFNEFFIKLNLSDVDCLKQTISKVLGTGIIVGSAFVKFPQILKLFNSKNAEGISFLGVLLELWAMASGSSYTYSKGYPFSSWGEVCFLMIETAIIGFLVLLYSNRPKEAYSFMALYSTICYMLFNGFVPMSVLWSIQFINLPIIIIGKLIQILKNYQNGHTGQLSIITVFLLFVGCLVRIFTSIQETGDSVMIFTFVVTSLINGMLVAQILYYWKATAALFDKEKTKNIEKKKEK